MKREFQRDIIPFKRIRLNIHESDGESDFVRDSDSNGSSESDNRFRKR